MRGDHGNVFLNGNYGTSLYCENWPQSGGSAPANAAIVIGDDASSTLYEITIRDLNVNGAGSGTYAVGADIGCGSSVISMLIENVRVYECDYAITSQGSSGTWRLVRVVAYGCYVQGFPGMPVDSDYIDCEAIGCSSHGFAFSSSINSRLIGCRAEWNHGHGFYVGGTASGVTGGVSMIGCSTDRNRMCGIYVDAKSDAWTLLISGYMSLRDGSTGTSSTPYAALAVTAATTIPVIVSDISCFPGFNDDGSGTQSPVYAIDVNVGGPGAPTWVQVSNAFLHAVTAPVNGVPSSGRNIAGRTGSWSSPGAVHAIADTA